MDDEVMGNAAYYRKREASERDLAESAPAPDIRKIHLQLAKRYAELAEEFEAEGRPASAFGPLG
jgi:hypothetical protein